MVAAMTTTRDPTNVIHNTPEWMGIVSEVVAFSLSKTMSFAKSIKLRIRRVLFCLDARQSIANFDSGIVFSFAVNKISPTYPINESLIHDTLFKLTIFELQ
jgi:hypothetical protein